jgi:hypothetical protein
MEAVVLASLAVSCFIERGSMLLLLALESGKNALLRSSVHLDKGVHLLVIRFGT